MFPSHSPVRPKDYDFTVFRKKEWPLEMGKPWSTLITSLGSQHGFNCLPKV